MAADKSGWVVGKVLAEQARSRGDAPFIRFEDGPMHSFAEAHLLSNRAGNGYAALGVGFGDNVAVMLNNRLEYLWSWFGLSRIGGVLVGINTALKGTFLTHVLSNTKARIGLFEPEYLPWLVEIEDTIPDMEVVYVPGGVYDAGNLPPFKRIQVRNFDDIMAGGEAEIPSADDISYRDIGMIMFTSGTTGPSKGALMPHGHLYLFGHCMQVHLGMTTEDHYYIPMPLFHAQGILMQLYATLITGGSAVLVRQFRATTWIDDIRKHKATLANLLGVMNDFVLRQEVKETDTDNNLRMVCAVPVTEETMQALRSRFAIPKFNEIFGMTECNLPVCRPLGAPEEAGCSGKVWDEYFEVIIADPDTDEEVATGEVGEILVRPKEPYCFMQGYNGMPERTVETWRNFWFHTGDAGRMDERGYVWYIDRIKDTIRRRGENISSFEVEAVFLDHEAIAECAAVAVKAEEGGEDEVLICIILEKGADTPKPEDLLDYATPRMPYFAVPRYIDYVTEIPTTPTAKIQKNKLRERGLSASAWDRDVAGYKVKR
ncbi:MAG: AMP-binding protein [Alphaproteobacteria bacterium]|jgi:crotonobetaine/carnitine-CoA ligase|nr:AMP-binding protein [Alphaproteobacteria bacterium]